MTDELTLKILAEIAAPGSGHLFSRREAARSAIALIEQQAARIAELEALLVKANDAWLAMSKTDTVAPAVDAQPVAWLVTGGKTFVDRAFVTEAHADKSIAERKDGARKVPLGRIDAALSKHTGEKDD